MNLIEKAGLASGDGAEHKPTSVTELTASFISLGAALCFLVRLQVAPITDTITITAAIICCVFFLVFLLIKMEVVDTWAGPLLLTSWTGALITTAIFTDGGHSPIFVLAPISPLIAAFLLGRTWGWYVAIALVVSLAIFGAFEQRGLYFTSFHIEGENIHLHEFWMILSILIGTLIGHHFAEENSRLSSTLKMRARIDFLTGIPNRLAIDESMDHAVRDAKRNMSWLSVLMMDIDHFKLFNDMNGHSAGDQCLKLVAGALRGELKRPYDFLGRYGGEEFCVILPRTDTEGAIQVAESLRKAIKALGIPYQAGKKETVSVTIGVFSSRGGRDGNADDMLKHADLQLYQGKKEGRDRVVAAIDDKVETLRPDQVPHS